MRQRRLTRRELIERCIVNGSLVAGVATMSQSRLLAAWQRAEGDVLSPTNAEVMGPFYRKNAPNIRVLRRPGDPGLPLRVSGTVWNTRGEVVPNAAVDVWQADFHGVYDLDGYQYRARIRPAADGTYWIETIMPGHYPDRPAQHIHYLISAPGHTSLVTQAYLATDPFFEGNPDGNFRKLNLVEHRELVRPVTLFEGDGTAQAAITFDIVLERA